MTNEQLIKKFTTLAEWAGMIQEECLNTRKVLERINAPAPKGGKQKGLSPEKAAILLMNFKKRNAQKYKSVPG